MNRYRFRLEPVLRVRRIEQDAARAAMAAADRDVDAADAALAASIDRYESLPVAEGGRPAAAWLTQRTLAGHTAASVVADGIGREVAAARLAGQRDAVRAARRRVAALERLDERRRGEHDVAARREEDLEVDELVTTRFGRTS